MALQNKVGFVTGAAQGIGKACAEILLQKGAKVYFGDLNQTVGSATLKEFQEKYGAQNVRFAAYDVTDSAKFTEVFNQAVAEFGHVDIMVNNAGILNEPQWRLEISINFTAMVEGTFLATEHMRKDKGGRGGRIVNMGSIASLVDSPHNPVYAGTKHAVRSFTTSMAMQPDIKEQGVQYATLCPHSTDTPMVRGLDGSKVHDFEQFKLLITEDVLMPSSTIAEGLLELLLLEDMNGRVLLVKKSEKTYHKMEPVVVAK